MSDRKTQVSEWAAQAAEVAVRKERQARALGIYGPGATMKVAMLRKLQEAK